MRMKTTLGQHLLEVGRSELLLVLNSRLYIVNCTLNNNLYSALNACVPIEAVMLRDVFQLFRRVADFIFE